MTEEEQTWNCMALVALGRSVHVDRIRLPVAVIALDD
jgi:hypothetical protein